MPLLKVFSHTKSDYDVHIFHKYITFAISVTGKGSYRYHLNSVLSNLYEVSELIDGIKLLWCCDVSCNYFISRGDYKTLTNRPFGDASTQGAEYSNRNYNLTNVLTWKFQLFDTLIPGEHHEVETAYNEHVCIIYMRSRVLIIGRLAQNHLCQK